MHRFRARCKVVGGNHFTWFAEASYQGTDLFSMYRDYVDSHFEMGDTKGDDSWLICSFPSGQRVKFDLFCRYGFIAAAFLLMCAEMEKSIQNI